MRTEQSSAVKLAQAITPDINVESGGVNSGITAAVSNVLLWCEWVFAADRVWLFSSVPSPGWEEDEVDAKRVISDDKGAKDATSVHWTLEKFPAFRHYSSEKLSSLKCQPFILEFIQFLKGFIVSQPAEEHETLLTKDGTAKREEKKFGEFHCRRTVQIIRTINHLFLNFLALVLSYVANHRSGTH